MQRAFLRSTIAEVCGNLSMLAVPGAIFIACLLLPYCSQTLVNSSMVGIALHGAFAITTMLCSYKRYRQRLSYALKRVAKISADSFTRSKSPKWNLRWGQAFHRKL
ncbi:hypothetical protein Q1695_009729 [Nippostrongylus brasiliensis]|nr:hypothetical protein Q1695_009729 [Nippostrongylus brasiliensis]